MATPKLSTQAQNSTLALIAPGIEAFKQQCMTGLVEIESAQGVFSVPVFAGPATAEDVEGYGMLPNQVSACIIVSRLRTQEGKPLINGRDRKLLIANALVKGIGVKTLDAIRCEIQLAFGEMSQRLADAIVNPSDFDEGEFGGKDSSEDLADELQADDDNEPDLDLSGSDPVPATVGSYTDGNVQHTPSQERAEGNSAPLGG